LLSISLAVKMLSVPLAFLKPLDLLLNSFLSILILDILFNTLGLL
jgi:hypothetical protein